MKIILQLNLKQHFKLNLSNKNCMTHYLSKQKKKKNLYLFIKYLCNSIGVPNI